MCFGVQRNECGGLDSAEKWCATIYFKCLVHPLQCPQRKRLTKRSNSTWSAVNMENWMIPRVQYVRTDGSDKRACGKTTTALWGNLCSCVAVLKQGWMPDWGWEQAVNRMQQISWCHADMGSFKLKSRHRSPHVWIYSFSFPIQPGIFTRIHGIIVNGLFFKAPQCVVN